MEWPLRLIRQERALALLLLLTVFGSVWLESHSPIAESARTGRPWACWLALRAPAATLPRLFWALYQPAWRTLDLVYVPETTALPDGRTPAKAHADALRLGSNTQDAARAMADAAQTAINAALPVRAVAAPGFFLAGQEMPPGEEPPLQARRWLLSRTQGLGFWLSLARQHGGTGLRPFEAFRIAQEAHGLAPDSARAAYLPPPDERAAYLARLLAAPQPRGGRAVIVEVLNASGRKGIASAAAKILRSKGADVIGIANATARARTLIYDRTGRPELAAEVKRLLGCDSAEVVTQTDASRLVDVTAAVADDCPEKE